MRDSSLGRGWNGGEAQRRAELSGKTLSPLLESGYGRGEGFSQDDVDHFRDLGLLSESGKPRLNVAQGYFRRDENENDLDLLESLYVYWRDMDEYLVLRSVQMNPKTLASQWKYVAVKCSKRGNDIYRHRVKRRLDWLSNGENVEFFDPLGFYDDKGWLKPDVKVSSSALWITLTYDTKRCSRAEAMENIGHEWNSFISALRGKYGQISVLRSWETSAQGFPHVHACLLFHDAKFTVFPYLAKNDEKEAQLQFRIEEKADIASHWHSHVDVQAMSSSKKLFNYMRKYQTKTLMASDSPKGVRTMSMLWLNRKRSFSVSGDFRRQLSDLIRTLHNSKTEIVQARLDGSLEDASIWEFVGVFSGQELGIRPGAWTSRLDAHAVAVVLDRESVFHRSAYGECDA